MTFFLVCILRLYPQHVPFPVFVCSSFSQLRSNNIKSGGGGGGGQETAQISPFFLCHTADAAPKKGKADYVSHFFPLPFPYTLSQLG